MATCSTKFCRRQNYFYIHGCTITINLPTYLASTTSSTSKQNCVQFNFRFWWKRSRLPVWQTQAEKMFPKRLTFFVLTVAALSFATTTTLATDYCKFSPSHTLCLHKVRLTFLKRAIPGLFFLCFRLFNTDDSLQMFNKFCRWLDSLLSEATTLPTEPQPLITLLYCNLSLACW